MTQVELGEAAGVSQRVIAYYEAEEAQPPGSLLVEFAQALKVSTDELLGLAPVRETLSPKTARLLKRLRRVEELPPADQRAVSKLVEALLETRRRATPKQSTTAPRPNAKQAEHSARARTARPDSSGRARRISL